MTRWNQVFASLICAITFCGALAAIAADSKSVDSTHKNTQERTFVFPKVKDFALLSVVEVPHAEEPWVKVRSEGVAFGAVKMLVPKNEWLILDLRRQALVNPNYLDSFSATGVDGISLHFLSMDGAEDGWCDAALEHLRHFNHLKCLIVNNSDVSDAGVTALAGLHDLEYLGCWITRIKGDCFKTLAQYRNFHSLVCHDCELKHESIKFLAQCPKLSWLDACRTGLDDQAVKELSACANMSVLRLAGNAKISDKCIKDLINMKHVSWLDLSDTNITLNGLLALKPMKLQRLTISQKLCSAKNLPSLKKVAAKVEFFLPYASLDEGTQEMLKPMH